MHTSVYPWFHVRATPLHAGKFDRREKGAEPTPPLMQLQFYRLASQPLGDQSCKGKVEPASRAVSCPLYTIRTTARAN